MRASLSRRFGLSALVVAGLLAGCGGNGTEEEQPANAPPTVDEVAGADDTGADDTGAEVGDEGDTAGDGAAGASAAVAGTDTVDLSVPPDPDPLASADDFPELEWAFEFGHDGGIYGREDFYEPNAVAQPGTFVGLAAQEAYRAGFAKGLADAQERRGAQQAAAEDAEAERLAEYPVGEVLEGWDPWVAVSDFWELGEVDTCDAAAAADPCLDTWYTFGNTEIIALGRLDPAAGAEPDQALLLKGTGRGFEVLEHWTAESGDPSPEWTQQR